MKAEKFARKIEEINFGGEEKLFEVHLSKDLFDNELIVPLSGHLNPIST